MIEEPQRPPHTNEHLANERTLLAWVRTAIAIMAFGFVIVKFSLFVHQISLLTGNANPIPNYRYSGPIGIMMVLLGMLSLIFGLWRYYSVIQQLKHGKFHHQPGWMYAFVLVLLILSSLLAIYLIKSA